ncbi:monooxygenase [Rhodobacterales bacterium HKCCE4037]|nr:monooxygenase [Rhodobacterales bacterium HKCCE4037]
MDLTHDVIIVGGGPVGMGLAIDLGQRGHSVAVIERYAEPQLVPKGQNMTQRTVEHFDAWGCEPDLRAARLQSRDVANGGRVAYGRLLTDHAYDWLPRENVQPFYGQRVERMPQYRTEAVLRSRAAQVPSIDIHYGLSFEGLEQDAEGVTVTAVGESGAQRFRGRYAVGCDGSRSGVRDAAGITQTVDEHDRKMVLLVFRSSELNELLARHHPPRSFYNALTPELEGYWRFLGRVDGADEWFHHSPVPADATTENFDFKALLHETVGTSFDVDLGYVGFWDLRFSLADQYRAGRVLIAGDACHSHPPYGGYGINTGFEDARNLGWKLSATLEGWGGEALLDSYEAERRPVFASLAADFIGKFIEEDRAFMATYSPEKDLQEFERKWADRNAGSAEVLAFEPNYEGSPVVEGEGTPSSRGDHRFEARPGHHLAPRALSDGRTTYEALGSGFTLFDFAGSGGNFGTAAEALGIPLTIISDTFDGERLDYEAEMILVRPDGFVAWCGAEADADAVLAQAVGKGC